MAVTFALVSKVSPWTTLENSENAVPFPLEIQTGMESAYNQEFCATQSFLIVVGRVNLLVKTSRRRRSEEVAGLSLPLFLGRAVDPSSTSC